MDRKVHGQASAAFCIDVIGRLEVVVEDDRLQPSYVLDRRLGLLWRHTSHLEFVILALFVEGARMLSELTPPFLLVID